VELSASAEHVSRCPRCHGADRSTDGPPALVRDLDYNSFASEADLKAAVDAVEAITGREATLTVDSQSYGRCLFDGLVPRSPRARINSPNLGWLWIGQARFTQLQP